MMIVEGADNVGKSTLVKQLLALDPRLRLLHRERFKPGKEETVATSYLRALIPADGDRLAHGQSLADRFLASECIYGKHLRGGCRMTPAEHLAIKLMLVSYNAIAIGCDAPDETIEASWGEREQTYPEAALKIARAYREEFNSVFYPILALSYNWTASRAEANRLRLIEEHGRAFAEQRDALTWWSANPHGVGQLRSPRLVLIGEAPSPQAKVPVPFANGPGGDFLAWSLEQAMTKLKRADLLSQVYITNADKGAENNAALLREELRFLQLDDRATVIALGRDAGQLVTHVMPQITRAHALHWAELPHPMYWRRFHWNARRAYVTKLVKALTQPQGVLA